MKSVFEMQERHLSATEYFVTKSAINYKSIQFCRAVFVLTGPELWPPPSIRYLYWTILAYRTCSNNPVYRALPDFEGLNCM